MDAAAFETGLDIDPADFGLRLAYSDWLEERGEADRAAFLRWQVVHRRVPAFKPFRTHRTPWGWSEEGSDGPVECCWLPRSMIRLMPALPDGGDVPDEEWKDLEGWLDWNDNGEPMWAEALFRTRRSAEAALFAAWVAAGRPEELA